MEREIFEMFIREVKGVPILSREEEMIIVRQVKMGDEAAIQKLIQANLRFVLKVVLKYQTPGLPLMDMVSEGCIGLISAIKTFEPDRNVRFLTYAGWWIKQRITSVLINHKKNELYSLDEPLYEREEETHKDLLTSKEIRLEDGISIKTLLSHLTEKERRVIELRFYQDMTYEEIGLSIGLTREGVRQIELRALRKLRWKIQNWKEENFNGHQPHTSLISDHSENNRG